MAIEKLHDPGLSVLKSVEADIDLRWGERYAFLGFSYSIRLKYELRVLMPVPLRDLAEALHRTLLLYLLTRDADLKSDWKTAEKPC